MKRTTGINGFGRFGLHLLKYWLDRNEQADFKIDFINDDYLDIKQAYEIITNDQYVKFNKYKVQIFGDLLIILQPNGTRHQILYTNKEQKLIPWIGKPDIFLECTGKYTESKYSTTYLKKNTKLVLISATSWDPDATLVFGYNHEEYNSNLKVISYGSCTVNAFIPFANWVNSKYKIEDSDVNVIHNIQEYRVRENNTLNRKFCTLEKSAKLMMDSINDDNFTVIYTVIPYTGVSSIDFRFKLNEKVNREEVLRDLEDAINHGSLKGLYGLDEKDIGPEVHNCTTFSTVFIKEGIKCLNGNLYVQGYFDNENSVNRFFDLTNFISSKQ
jgi:glyceraldehyde 3-phosphate dehydrogenase